MNHKWKDNVCVHCGLKREKREYEKAGLPYSVLGKDGCWYDRIPYTFHVGWYYGSEHKFERPECVRSVQKGLQLTVKALRSLGHLFTSPPATKAK